MTGEIFTHAALSWLLMPSDGSKERERDFLSIKNPEICPSWHNSWHERKLSVRSEGPCPNVPLSTCTLMFLASELEGMQENRPLCEALTLRMKRVLAVTPRRGWWEKRILPREKRNNYRKIDAALKRTVADALKEARARTKEHKQQHCRMSDVVNIFVTTPPHTSIKMVMALWWRNCSTRTSPLWMQLNLFFSFGRLHFASRLSTLLIPLEILLRMWHVPLQ